MSLEQIALAQEEIIAAEYEEITGELYTAPAEE